MDMVDGQVGVDIKIDLCFFLSHGYGMIAGLLCTHIYFEHTLCLNICFCKVETICAAILSKPRGVVALGKKFYQQQVQNEPRKSGLYSISAGATPSQGLPSRRRCYGWKPLVQRCSRGDSGEIFCFPLLLDSFFPGVQRKAKTSFHSWRWKGSKLKIEEREQTLFPILELRTKTTHSWSSKPMPELLPFCNKLLQTSPPLTAP